MKGVKKVSKGKSFKLSAVVYRRDIYPDEYFEDEDSYESENDEDDESDEHHDQPHNLEEEENQPEDIESILKSHGGSLNLREFNVNAYSYWKNELHHSTLKTTSNPIVHVKAVKYAVKDLLRLPIWRGSHSDQPSKYGHTNIKLTETVLIAWEGDIKEEELTNKRPRETSGTMTDTQPNKKLKNVTMEPLVLDDPPSRPKMYVVKLVPDIEDVHLFTKKHGEILTASVKSQLSKEAKAKEWALNVVPKLSGLWKDSKIKSIDCGEVPRLIRATAIFDNPAPEILDFFDEIELKNETIDTNDWRPFNRKEIQGDRTIVFFGVDEKATWDLKAIRFRLYFSNGRIRISIDGDKQNK
ncbi:hypothetical protein Bhyg_07897 [Pseudolycoriella hygida]|uniref:DUF4780 domain-containing protein n=1 Tax=Pseudolycoriella hygida TaxID=35572 RepID=A0A9Q0N4H9_9DIPT|nr:hypothetical protein Bhyg_07897 [Pseudolycoriella hygida]